MVILHVVNANQGWENRFSWNMNLLLTKCDQMTFQECPKCKQPIAGRAHDFENMLKEL